MWHRYITVETVFSERVSANQKHGNSLVLSILISLIAHLIVSGNIACRTDSSGANSTRANSTFGLIANLSQAKSQPELVPVSEIPSPPNNTAEKPSRRGLVVPNPEETVEEFPYAPPDSIEQMASIIDPPDLPLPSESFNAAGFMRIKIYVNEEGLADNIELLESNFADDYVSTVVRLFKLAKFSPGVSGGKAIKSWRIVEIDYSSS